MTDELMEKLDALLQWSDNITQEERDYIMEAILEFRMMTE